MEWIDSYGLPVAIMGIMGVGIWRVGVYLASRVVEPLVEGHTQFLIEMRARAKEHSDTTKELLVSHQDQTRTIEKILQMEVLEGTSLEDLHAKVDKLIERGQDRRKSQKDSE